MLLLNICAITSTAQQFYVNSSPLANPYNKTYLLTIDSCDWITDSTTLPVFSCPNTTAYDDIAFDNTGNIWYTDISGSVYKRKVSDTTCQFIGTSPAGHNAMVADTTGNIYLAGGYVLTINHKSGVLSKYNGNSFTLIDTLPNGMFSAGDLFFFENRLFLTAVSQNYDSTYIAEINIKSPRHSCYYMSLDGFQPYGAFSIYKESTFDRVFILSVDKPNNNTTSLIEIDIPNKKILDTLCVYPFLARGAASRYNAIWDSTTCPPPSGISSTAPEFSSITVLHPVRDRIRLKTSIEKADIKSVSLYSMSGQKLKSYRQHDFPNNLDLSNVPSGLYLLQVKTIAGGVWNKKIMK